MNEKDIEQLKLIAADIRFNEPMSAHTSFKIGGNAEVFINASSSLEIGAVQIYCLENNVPCTFIGNGSNILVGDNGIDGVVIAIGTNMSRVQVVGELIYVEAGALMSQIAAAALKEGLTGFEALSGIPGTIGGAVYMNAGAYNHDVKSVLRNITFLMSNSDMVTIDTKEADMSYRHSIFMENDGIITGCCIQLQKGNAEEIKAKMKEFAKSRRDKQPLDMPSAGSTFKRPEGDFAGRLIQEAGLMGMSVGGAQVSTKHAGFVVNTGGATAADVLTLIKKVQAAVKEKFGTELEPEVRLIGNF